MSKFRVVSGRIHVTDPKLEEDTHGMNLWDLRVKNGVWIVDAPEDGSYIRCSHAVSRILSDMNETYEAITINSGMISIMDAEHFTSEDVEALQDMIEDDFGNNILMANGLLMGTKHEQGVYEVSLSTDDQGDVISIYVDLDHEI